MGKLVVSDSELYVKEKGYVPVKNIKPGDKIFILDERSRYGFVDCWFTPEKDMYTGVMYNFYLKDEFTDIIVKRKYECRIALTEDAQCTVVFNGEVKTMSASELYDLVALCHRGQNHSIELYSWGDNIENRVVVDELVTVPVKFFKTTREQVELVEVYALDVPDDIGVLIRQDGNSVFV